MRINYFDLGANSGGELRRITNALEEFGYAYAAFAFEPNAKWYQRLTEKFKQRRYPNLSLIKLGVSDRREEVPLYYCPNELGHSIYRDKYNVTDEFETIQCVAFSEWIEETVPDFRECFNIVKINIEGAEWQFFNDIISNDIAQHFHVYCGAGYDLRKIESMKNKLREFKQLLEDNGIDILRYVVSDKPGISADLPAIIKEKYSAFVAANAR